MSVEANNPHLVKRVDAVKAKRAKGEPTVPSLMKDEKMTNPFLRIDKSREIRLNVGVLDSDPDHVAFGKLRKAKDNFQ
jgi:hydroxyacylglutathione hydrolase